MHPDPAHYPTHMPTRPHHLFVVEDDPALRSMLSDYLEK